MMPSEESLSAVKAAPPAPGTSKEAARSPGHWETCDKCGSPCAAGSPCCDVCGARRAKDADARAASMLAQAMAFRRQHQYDRALNLLRSAMQSKGLSRALNDQLLAAIERVHRKQARSKVLVAKAMERASNWLARGERERASRLLRSVPEALRNPQVDALLQQAQQTPRPYASERRVETALRAAQRLNQEHDYGAALVVLAQLSEAHRLTSGQAAAIELVARKIREKRERSESLVRDGMEQAKRFLKKHSHEKAARILRSVPQPLRTREADELLELATNNAKRIDTLHERIQRGVMQHDIAGGELRRVVSSIDELLRLKPNHQPTLRAARTIRARLVRRAESHLARRDCQAAAETLRDVPACEQNADLARLWKRIRETAATSNNSRLQPTQQIDLSPPARPALFTREARPRLAIREHLRARKPWLQRLEELNQNCVKSRWLPWACSSYFNIMVLLVLACIVMLTPTRKTPLILSMTLAAEPEEVPLIVDTIEEEPVESEPEEEEQEEIEEEVTEETPVEETAETPPPEPRELVVADVPTDLTSGDMDEESTETSDQPSDEAGESDAAAQDTVALTPLPPSHAVSSGNFAVWTEPEIPNPNEPYEIHIQIRLPDRVKSYPRSDLTGVIIGSDGYRKPIDLNTKELVPIIHHTVEIVIPVVGAQRPVGDVVIVRSRILREQRVLKLSYEF